MMTNLVILAVSAVVVQFVTEQLKQMIAEAYRSQWTQLLAAGVGIAVAFTLQTGIFQAFGITVAWPWFDYLLTGIAFSAGAVAFNELLKLVSELRPSNNAGTEELATKE